MLIERIHQILEIKALQNEFKEVHNREPYNVSSWLTSEAFSQTILSELQLPRVVSPVEYAYTYSFDKQILQEVKKKLLLEKYDQYGISLSANTTQAIMSLVNLVKQYNYKKICILNPAYFSIAQALKAFGLDYDTLTVERIDGHYVLPYDELMKGQYDVVWITSPIFSTSVYFQQNDIEMINALMKKGTLVISDESFCTPGNELVRRLDYSDNFIAMYSPHKSLGVNGVKFSAIICPPRFDNFIEHWVDILTGNLPESTCVAINHYLDDNYDQCLGHYRQFIHGAYKKIHSTLSGKENIMMDKIEDGSLFTLYFKNLNYDQIKSVQFMKETIFETETSFYPSYLNGFNESFGFAFRINTALYDEDFLNALNNLVTYLAGI